MPYVSDDLPLVKKVFSNCEKARTWDAYLNQLPGMLASINDVTDGSEDIPDYASACGIASVAFEEIQRRDIVTPYSTFGLFLHNPMIGFCWYNNMLKGPRMQSFYGSTEAINVNGTEISPLVTWDSKITTLLAMLGGIGSINKRALALEKDYSYSVADTGANFKSSYERFVYIVEREYALVFGDLKSVRGDGIGFQYPDAVIPMGNLPDWQLTC